MTEAYHIHRRNFLKHLGLTAASLSGLTLPCAGRAANQKPNIVLLIADDYGYADMRFLPFAARDAHTPNLDRLAKTGVYFTNAYVTSPICSASRGPRRNHYSGPQPVEIVASHVGLQELDSPPSSCRAYEAGWGAIRKYSHKTGRCVRRRGAQANR